MVFCDRGMCFFSFFPVFFPVNAHGLWHVPGSLASFTSLLLIKLITVSPQAKNYSYLGTHSYRLPLFNDSVCLLGTIGRQFSHYDCESRTWPISTNPASVKKRASVKALFRWATGKRSTNRLPKLSLTTLSSPGTAGYSGPARIYGSTCHQHAVPISGDPGRVFSGSKWES